MQVAVLKRQFSYNGAKLDDINPKMSMEEIKNRYALLYPEIASASVEGPACQGNVMVYTFKRSVGTKG